ncbi:hypothetical protein D3218_11970 [Aureimonas flava]|uniref:Uncharacterized protein n=1 Tax=Aureimonas flava TaxID=2320271 RepID=A0A3A1WHC3_9HYPH|nr:hypothetical protein [Aureimonas flava]RIY00013.1 hypothetical protein D3218_11970 [Aureimonas flava]
MRTAVLAPALLLVLAGPALAEDLPQRNQIELFGQAEGAGLTGTARKTRAVDARPAREGEVVVTVIPGEGVETTSKPAEPGDWVVRNRCSADKAANPTILVKAARFPERYGAPQGEPDAEGFREFHPSGQEMGFFLVSPETGAFQFVAPWGTPMVAKPGDAIVQIPGDRDDTYRIARAEFDCTYEVLKAPAAK